MPGALSGIRILDLTAVIAGPLGMRTLADYGADVNVVDRLTGITAVHAILAALFHRERTGQGQAVEIPMFENLIEFHLGDHMAGNLYDPPTGPMGNVRALSPNRRPYQTKDGTISMLIGIEKHWTAFLEIAGLTAIHGRDPRFATQAARRANSEAMLASTAEA